MDFNLNAEQLMFRATARKFAEAEIAPHIAEMEKKQRTSPLESTVFCQLSG